MGWDGMGWDATGNTKNRAGWHNRHERALRCGNEVGAFGTFWLNRDVSDMVRGRKWPNGSPPQLKHADSGI